MRTENKSAKSDALNRTYLIRNKPNFMFPTKNKSDTVAEFKIAFETEKEILNCFRFDRVILSRSELGNSITRAFGHTKIEKKT